jgi:hypothetical protein
MTFTTAFGRSLSRLTFSDRFATAAEQAMLDWRHEASLTRSMVHRAWCASRFAFALVRISASVTAAEIVDIVSSSWAVRLGFWMALITWMSFAPVAASREHASAENAVRWWLSLSGALSLSPALAVFTARSSGRAPIAGFALVSIFGMTAIHQVIVPFAANGLAGYTVPVAWSFVAIASLVSMLMLAIAERSRTDLRRWLVTGVLAGALILPILSANAARIAVWLSDAGLIPGDTVYLPHIPTRLLVVFSQGPWAMLALLAITFAWLSRRHARLARK